MSQLQTRRYICKTDGREFPDHKSALKHLENTGHDVGEITECMHTSPEPCDHIVIDAALAAVEQVSRWPELYEVAGSTRLSGVVHDFIVANIAKLDPRWNNTSNKGSTPDLMNKDGQSIQVKCHASPYPIGNKVTKGNGRYILVRLRHDKEECFTQVVKIKFNSSELASRDWFRDSGNTNLSIMTKAAYERLRTIYPIE